jgi:hypothetical protein
MSVNTIIKDGLIELIQFPVTIWDLDENRWHHNPSIARDTSGKIWVSSRHHEEKPAIRYANPEPYSHPTSWLMLGVLDEKTLKVSGVKRIKPDKSCPIYIQEKEIEDVRIFWRKDGLHGIGVAINAHSFAGETRVYEMEILIDYEKGTYKLLKDYGYIKGHMEKNWTPASTFAQKFDYIYSPTEVVLENKVYGHEYSGITHGGSQALPYQDGWLRLAHQVIQIPGITHRWYVSLAERLNAGGFVTHNSQFFDMCTGWRPQIKESVELITGAVWSKGKEEEELLVSYGLRDETCAFTRIPMDMFRWETFNPDVSYYNWKFEEGIAPIDPALWQGQKFTGSIYSDQPASQLSRPWWAA